MGLMDRDYMHRRNDQAGSKHAPGAADVQKLLTKVRPARLIPAYRQWLFLILGGFAGYCAGIFFPVL